MHLFRDFHPWFRAVADLWAGAVGTPAPEPPGGWVAFGQWLKHAKLAGLFHQCASASGHAEAYPASLMEELQRERYHIAAHGAQLEVLAAEVCAFLATGGFKAVPLKGIWLNRKVYGDASLRRTTDVDLLVPPGAADALAPFLAGKGYRRMPLEHEVEWQAVFKGKGLFPVEAHALLSTPDENPPPSVELLERGHAWGEADEGLDPADAFVYLCINNARDNLVLFPGNLVDLVAVAERFGTGAFWDAVVTRARAWRWSTGVALNLQAARELFGLQVPEIVEERLASSWWRGKAAKTALDRYRGTTPTVSQLPRGWGSLYKMSIVEDVGPLGYLRRRKHLAARPH